MSVLRALRFRRRLVARRARRAEAAARFDDAFRCFSWEAERLESESEQPHGVNQSSLEDIDRAAELWMRAARSAESNDLWRVQAGTWEWLGNFLGRMVGDTPQSVADVRYRSRPERGRAARFYVISDWEWGNPRHADESSYDDWGSEQRHRRAWAFTWAANCARSDSEFAHAARLYRRAAVAWEQSHHDERLRRAALCYYEAAVSAAQTGRFETRSMILTGWCPSCVLEMKTEQTCSKHDHINETHRGPEEEVASDITRLIRCWETLANQPPNVVDASGNLDRQLAGIQRALSLSGAADEARVVYRRRRNQRTLSHIRRWHPAAVRDALSYALSYYGTRVWQFVVAMTCVYAVLIPTLWWTTGAVQVAGAERAATWPESLTFALSGALTLWTGYFQPGSEVMNLVLALQSLSGVFAVGYAIWMLQRSYDE